MPLPRRHLGRSDRKAHESVASDSAWQPQTACAGVVGLYPSGYWGSRPCPRPYPLTQARPKQGPLAPVTFPTFIATTGPSDSLSTRQDFALGLYPPPSPDVGRRGGSPQFRIRLSLRAVFNTPEASCVSPASRRSLLPSPWRDRLGHFPFRVPISRGCKVHALAFGPQVCSPHTRPYGLGRAFDAPHKRRPLGRRREPATRRSGSYRGGTSTRKSDPAPRPGGPGPA